MADEDQTLRPTGPQERASLPDGSIDIPAKIVSATSRSSRAMSREDVEEILDLVSDQTNCSLVFDALAKRLRVKNDWRCIVKALLLVQLMIHRGLDDVIRQLRERSLLLETLQLFPPVYEGDMNKGTIVRIRAVEVLGLLRGALPAGDTQVSEGSTVHYDAREDV
ncbi:hypothetical protein EXIGLDRAFT_838232 [Exidia glandulosa HHB12029]|uniref:ENTH domain-containing protein n=1 Tax=Exidia glandulosa HHB12029 TaxID=1314781 RepID=A0A165G1F3_EXIGL|nr:hypothetical protein EXIGLDRAFT_838232 [Exidia glandulosa HHB12029]